MVLVQNMPFFQLFCEAIHGFGQKLAMFSIFLSGNLGPENGFFYDILRWKNAFVSFKNKELKKTKNWYVFKGVSPWFWSKIGHFSIFSFLGNLSQENVFYDILERKRAFLWYKNKELKKSKNWFWSKIGHFSIVFFWGNLGQENVFYDILQQKNAFLGYKNKTLKSEKIDMFSKGLVYGFGPKLLIFPSSFFWAI